MKVKEAIFASRFQQAGMFDEDGHLILAGGHAGGYIDYSKHAMRTSNTFGGQICHFAYLEPSKEIIESDNWKPISPL